jgi:hypothetical protein
MVLVLYLLEPTSDAALIFYGASMWLAALRCRRSTAAERR